MLSTVYAAILILLMQNGYITGLNSWPDGSYGLLKPTTGCPEEWSNRNWELKSWAYKGWTDKGYIFQVTEDNYPNSTRSKTLRFEGHIGPDFVLRYFCVKRTSYVQQSSIKWPPGKYCIYSTSKYNFYNYLEEWGYIQMFNKEHATKHVDNIINNEWYNPIELYFGCQTSGNKKIPMSLPITQPFYLLPYGSRDCQQVQWMVVTTEWIKHHTNNYHTDNFYGRRTYKSGTVPYHELGDRNHKGITMYYCYYESCNYTLRGNEGVFQSPGFPGQYPDGQLCSWKIRVPTNCTVHVHFTNFSLHGTDDKLQFYRMIKGSETLNDTFNGNRHPRQTLIATSHVQFVFLTNSWGNSTGFRAKYRIFKPKKITTTPLATTTRLPTTTKPTTTDKPTTTTKPPTTKPIQTNKPPKPNPHQGKTKTDEPTRKITQTTWNTSNNGVSNKLKGSPLLSCGMTSKIVVMVIPLACCIFVIVLVVDIVYRCRRAKNKEDAKTKNSRNGDCLAVNMTYERGDIILDQTADTTVDTSTVNAVDDQPQSRDDPPDYEDLDYTQVDEIPPSRRSTKRQECYELEPIGNDTSVFYHVLEPPKAESERQIHVDEPVGQGGPEVFYHTLESPTDLNRPTYQNLSEVNHYTLNPVYEPTENSAPLVEANKLYDNYIA